MTTKTRKQRTQATPGRYVWLLEEQPPVVGEVVSRLATQFTVSCPKWSPSTVCFLFYKDKGDSWRPATSGEFSHRVKTEDNENDDRSQL